MNEASKEEAFVNEISGVGRNEWNRTKMLKQFYTIEISGVGSMDKNDRQRVL